MTHAPPSAPLPAVAFVGGGNMASAMITGLLTADPTCRITVSEPDPQRRAAMTARGLQATPDNTLATASADLVILAIKPQMASRVLPEIAAAWNPDKRLVSILAGTPTARLEALLPPGARVVRAMPNTPLAIGMGMVGLCRGRHATEADLAAAEALFAPGAAVLRVGDETRMDAVTAVSGSGPAYVFLFTEALVAAAESLGFTPDEALLLVSRTGSGSWEYLARSGFRARELREQVTSPGGTTAAAIAVLEQGGFADLIRRAVEAARRRGIELASA